MNPLSRPEHRRWLGALGVIVAGVVLAACVPEPPPSLDPPVVPEPPAGSVTPAPSASTPATACGSAATGSESELGYAATVEADGQRRVVHLGAEDPVDLQRHVEVLEQLGQQVIHTEPVIPVSALAIDDPYVAPAGGGRDPLYGQWGIERVRAEAGWAAAGTKGHGVVVAVVDTGVRADHPGLLGRVLPGRDYVATPPGDGRIDGNGHGTHVAGIIAENDDAIGGVGVAPDVSILPVRALGNTGSGSSVDVAEGIRWAYANGADVINLSLGTQCSVAIRLAVDEALAAGVVVVAAAGNGGSACTPAPNPPSGECSAPTYPAAHAVDHPGLVAVAATTRTNERAPYSNVNDYVSIAAPGGGTPSTGNGIWSTVPSGYGYKAGTSMASAHVAGVAALIRARCPALLPAQVVAALTAAANVQDLGPTGRDDWFGAGLVQADEAILGAC